MEHSEWVATEVGIEHPTHLETLRKPEQRVRINWLKEHCDGSVDILDLGCNWGYVLNEVNGRCGVDVNPENIDKAQVAFPKRYFLVGDITKKLPFKDEQYAIVILADVLEHLEYPYAVSTTLLGALRIARIKVLITLPWKKSEDCAECFKHSWIPNYESLGRITSLLAMNARYVRLETDTVFMYIEVLK